MQILHRQGRLCAHTTPQLTSLPFAKRSNCPRLVARDTDGLSTPRDAIDAAGALLCRSMLSAREENLLSPSAPAYADDASASILTLHPNSTVQAAFWAVRTGQAMQPTSKLHHDMPQECTFAQSPAPFTQCQIPTKARQRGLPGLEEAMDLAERGRSPPQAELGAWDPPLRGSGLAASRRRLSSATAPRRSSPRCCLASLPSCPPARSNSRLPRMCCAHASRRKAPAFCRAFNAGQQRCERIVLRLSDSRVPEECQLAVSSSRR